MEGFPPRNLKYMRAFGEAWPEAEFVQGVLAQLPGYHQLALLDAVVALGRRHQHAADRDRQLRVGLRSLYRHSLREHGSTLSDAEIDRWLAMDVELNAQGMAVWLDRPPA